MRALFAIAIIFAASSIQAITIDMVPVGNPGNAPDILFSFAIGSVAYKYQIGKYEITAGQYTEFLNAVAKDDPNGLYNVRMSDPTEGPFGAEGANIERAGSAPNYSYSVAGDWANRPVNEVSFWDAARFANWLHNGQPTGAQGPETTESGAYHDIGDQTLFGRNAGARFFIPTADEWHKAAYHKNDGVTGNYWDYPTGSNAAPINTLPDSGNHANFDDGQFQTGNHGRSIGAPYFRTEVGAFAKSASPYGTFDQGGNVSEWTETISTWYGVSARVIRGGGYSTDYGLLYAGYRSFYNSTLGSGSEPTQESSGIGFRVAAAAVPEPSTMILAAAFVALPTRRRKLVPHNRV
jgi:sulfatase modifying factor 1